MQKAIRRPPQPDGVRRRVGVQTTDLGHAGDEVAVGHDHEGPALEILGITQGGDVQVADGGRNEAGDQMAGGLKRLAESNHLPEWKAGGEREETLPDTAVHMTSR